MENNIIQIIAGSAVVSSIVSVAGSIITKMIFDKKSEKLRSETEIKLKKVEHNFQQSNSNIQNLLEIQKSNYSISQERRILAIDKSWESIIEFRNSFPSSIRYIYNLLTDDEIINFLQEADSVPELKVLKEELKSFDWGTIYIHNSDLQDTLSLKRPFLGDKLYFLLRSYNTIISRIYYLTADGFSKGSLYHWKNDQAIMNILKDILEENEIKHIVSRKTSVLNYTQEFVENKIVTEINAVISGNVASEDSFAHLSKLRNLFVN